jgi:hypothetical protein
MEKNTYTKLQDAIENKGSDEAIVNLGDGYGFKIIPADDW